jgi:aerobic-type carbon monoxide dehydrogenase small subunit (CoxS/CutS family)
LFLFPGVRQSPPASYSQGKSSEGGFFVATHFILNGKPATVDVNPDMPLLWVLRDALNMTGTKFGCGMALCGACTVHVEGQAIRSCITPISAMAGKHVTTIEGLSATSNHPVQVAWRQIDVPQCGYCQSGQIMSAAALLAKTPKPTDAQIDDAMTGNICRCGTYPRIRKAIHVAAQIQAGAAKPAAAGPSADADPAPDSETVLAGGAE